MKLYVCWGTCREPFHGHACRIAHQALLAAGYEPEVIKVRGLGVGPKLLQWTTTGRREVEELSGQKVVPVLLTDDGEAIVESQAIVAWAEAHSRAAQPNPS
jgi:glutathione S-transferase